MLLRLGIRCNVDGSCYGVFLRHYIHYLHTFILSHILKNTSVQTDIPLTASALDVDRSRRFRSVKGAHQTVGHYANEAVLSGKLEPPPSPNPSYTLHRLGNPLPSAQQCILGKANSQKEQIGGGGCSSGSLAARCLPEEPAYPYVRGGGRKRKKKEKKRDELHFFPCCIVNEFC